MNLGELMGIWPMLLLGLFIPFLARLEGVPAHGHQWLTSYLPGFGGVGLICIFNLLPLLVVALFALPNWRHPGFRFYASALTCYWYLLVMHGRVDLASDAQASFALVFIPMRAMRFAIIGGLCGMVIDVTQNRLKRSPCLEKIDVI
jgi:hypothetical protein